MEEVVVIEYRHLVHFRVELFLIQYVGISLGSPPSFSDFGDLYSFLPIGSVLFLVPPPYWRIFPKPYLGKLNLVSFVDVYPTSMVEIIYFGCLSNEKHQSLQYLVKIHPLHFQHSWELSTRQDPSRCYLLDTYYLD